MGKKVGALIKAARTDAGMTQEQLARKVRNCSASDISKAERGEKDLTQDQLRQIAKATGVTQASLLNAEKKKTTASGKTGTTSTARKTSMQVTATERRLVELYRAADSNTKKDAMRVLKGGDTDVILQNLLEGAVDALTGKK